MDWFLYDRDFHHERLIELMKDFSRVMVNQALQVPIKKVIFLISVN